MDITKEIFGKLPDGREVELYRLTNNKGLQVEILNYGGIIKSIFTPDKHHNPADVVLGFDNLEGYIGEHPYFGVILVPEDRGPKQRGFPAVDGPFAAAFSFLIVGTGPEFISRRGQPFVV